MENLVLTHHGVLGQKWGIRRYQNKDGTRTTLGKKREKNGSAETESDRNKQKFSTAKSMTDDELRASINRLQLEKTYNALYAELNKTMSTKSNKTDEAKKFVADVLKKSGSNIANQLATYAMGTLVNKAFKAEIVNPKKGQKDK